MNISRDVLTLSRTSAEPRTMDMTDSHTPQPTRFRALIAEDDYAYRVAIARMLAEIGIDSVGVEDGLAAAELLERVDEPLAIAITDFRMPRASGFRVIEAARAFRGPSFPVIMETAESQYSDVYRRALDLGVPLVAKRDIYTHLIPAVRTALGSTDLALFG